MVREPHTDFAGNPRDLITHASLSVAWIETALRRWRARPRTVIGNTVSPVEALDGLHAWMTARHQTAVRWIDLIFIERHALGILYPHPVGHSWPGQ